MNQTEQQPIVVFEHVSKRYGNGTLGLKDVNFSVYPGEFIAVIGPSGAGKSTLLRSINKLHNVTEGRILIGGEDISKAKGSHLRTLRRKIGMIFQNYNLVYRLSVLQNVLHGRLGYMGSLQGMIGRYREEDKEKAVELLKEIDMGDFLNMRAADLSGGQKQRVGIARAFMQEPQILTHCFPGPVER
jgi:phosphonate transport system ATP-binding protein